MDKLEYIPGDLVMTKTEPNNFVPNGVVCEFVSYGNRNKVLVRAAKGIDTFFLEKGQITPIPLTPEILEKNGWREDKGDYINDSYHIILCEKYDSFSAYKGVNNSIVWLRDVRNISDLQHLLFGLNINSEMEV